jgi:hypothetical protein
MQQLSALQLNREVLVTLRSHGEWNRIVPIIPIHHLSGTVILRIERDPILRQIQLEIDIAEEVAPYGPDDRQPFDRTLPPRLRLQQEQVGVVQV